MTPSRIGFDRFIRLDWLDQAALLAAEHRDAEALRKALQQRLERDMAGKEAQQKTIIQLTRIWWRVPDEHVRLRDEGLARFGACSSDDRLVYHWGMTLLAFPLFGQVAATIGRLLRLQGSFRQLQLSQRIKADWGHNTTLDTALPRAIRSLLDWGVLKGMDERGVYSAGRQIAPTGAEHELWLLETLMLSRGVDLPLSDLLRAPELFPFAIQLTSSDLQRSAQFQLHQQGQDMAMVHLAATKNQNGVPRSLR